MSKETTVRSTNTPLLIYRFVTQIFPLVKEELNKWRALAEKSPDRPLAEQALDSIATKSFHCQGGSIYALYPGVNSPQAVEFIVAYQTISDYLDNLVDSMPVQDEQAFRQLHLAMEEALDPEAKASDYYRYYPYQDDGGYLLSLVQTCQDNVRRLPGYAHAKPVMIHFARLYSQLQTYKHLSLDQREQKMLGWIQNHLQDYPGLSPWEFAAATGSTLGIFCLYAAAFNPGLTALTVQQVKAAYFPWICGLHILLDYFIDLQEDLETKQLNFVQYYADAQEMQAGLHRFLIHALKGASMLPYPKFHQAVIRGLLAMYLSDKKSSHPEIQTVTRCLLQDGGLGTELLHWVCCNLRSRQVI